MIGIFQGRGIASKSSVFAQVDVNFRNHIEKFSDNGSLAPLAVFMCLALHANEGGWAWPGRDTLTRETGLKSTKTLSKALEHLRTVKIENQRVFTHYRVKLKDGRWGGSAYLLFPDQPHGKPPFPNMYEWGEAGVPASSGFVYLVRYSGNYRLGFDKNLVERLRRLRQAEDFKEVIAWYPALDAGQAAAAWVSAWAPQHANGQRYYLDQLQVTGFTTYAIAHQGRLDDPKGLTISIDDYAPGKNGRMFKKSEMTWDKAEKIADGVQTASEVDDFDFDTEFKPKYPKVSQDEFKVPDGMSPQEYASQRVVAATKRYLDNHSTEDAWGTNTHACKWVTAHNEAPVGAIIALGKALEKDIGMAPAWDSKQNVLGWFSGLWECLKVAKYDQGIVVAAARRLRGEGLSVANPYSLVKTTQAMQSESVGPRIEKESKAVKNPPAYYVN